MIFTGEHSTRKMITWQINNTCNFNCDYCSQQHNNPKRSDIDLNILSESLNLLSDEWIIYITGGEPFLERNIIDIGRTVTEKHYLSMNTNLSTSNVYEFANEINPSRTLNITASIHITEREKRDKNLHSFIDKVLYFQTKGFNIIASYVLHPLLFERVNKDIDFLKSMGVQKVRVKIFRGIYNKNSYPKALTQHERDFLQSMEADFPEFEILSETQNYYGLECAVGQDFFIMNRTGNLRRCSGTYRNYGNLFEKTLTRDIKFRPCPLKNCTCPYEGIRNVKTAKSNFNSRFVEVVNQKYFKSKRVLYRLIEDPNSVKHLSKRVFNLLPKIIGDYTDLG